MAKFCKDNDEVIAIGLNMLDFDNGKTLGFKCLPKDRLLEDNIFAVTHGSNIGSCSRDLYHT